MINETFGFYSQIAMAIGEYNKTDNPEIKARIEETLKEAEKTLPSGGVFIESRIDIKRSVSQRLVLLTSCKHVTAGGQYDSVTRHQIIITPCLMNGFNIRVTGPERRGIKEKIEHAFSNLI